MTFGNKVTDDYFGRIQRAHFRSMNSWFYFRRDGKERENWYLPQGAYAAF